MYIPTTYVRTYVIGQDPPRPQSKHTTFNLGRLLVSHICTYSTPYLPLHLPPIIQSISLVYVCKLDPLLLVVFPANVSHEPATWATWATWEP